MADTCNTSVNYSNDTSGERILPFKFTLTDDSVLHPAAGQHQKFCYDIEGEGSDTSAFADLSHFLFGICPNITEEDFFSITVTKNGVPQNVDFGENVEIKTAEHPDNPTGCTGLKFDFSLDKEEGNIIHVCFEMNSVFSVGATNVCIFGGRVTKTGMSICGPVCGSEGSCTTTVFQQETVCASVTVTPFAHSDGANVVCCGTPVVSSEPVCTTANPSCRFTVRQTICVEIPITFGADVEVGDASVSCGIPSSDECPCLDSTAQATRSSGSRGCSCF